MISTIRLAIRPAGAGIVGIALVLAATVILAAGRGEAPVDRQPLAAQVRRLIAALDYLGAPLTPADRAALERALSEAHDAASLHAIETVLDRSVLVDVRINPESRIHVTQGAAPPDLVQDGWRTFLVKVRNEAGVTAELKVDSPQAQRVFSRGPSGFATNPRPAQTITAADVADRWLDMSLADKPPLTPRLSGLALEYRILQVYSRDAGRREASLAFNVGQGSQDIGFRNDAPILFTARPAQPVTLRVRDEAGRPTVASFTIRDAQGHVYPSPAKRLAPDFAFHPQIYRADGERLSLAAGTYIIDCTRGPEYLVERQTVTVADGVPATIACGLQRWIDPARRGWYSGDHHIHAAGCLHYETPTQGVRPQDMWRHIVGEGLHVGAVLTWGPGYYFQKQFFTGADHPLSTPQQVMHYDLEVSGFPSSHAGHLVLLGLKEQDYPGTKTLEDWPTWDLPVLQWAKAQGAVVGFAHSGWGLEVTSSTLPNEEMPGFDGIGANEYIVDVTHDAVDFISTIDTPSVWELNIWYHTLNSGFRTRISGETDFPCIYGERVGLGRSYVQLPDGLAYARWVDGLRDGRAYVSDGRSHLLDFRVNGQPVGTRGSELSLKAGTAVRVTATVAARLDETPNDALRGRRLDEQPYWDLERARIARTREVPVEVIVNGRAVATTRILADGQPRDLSWEIPIARSSWVALRILPSSHTNPFFLIADGRPGARLSSQCRMVPESRRPCWRQKSPQIAAAERELAARAYEHARATYRRIAVESLPD